MSTDVDLDRYIEHAASMLSLPLRPEWKPAVRENLAVTLAIAAAVQEFPLPDDIEPAPVFRA
jgi:hypothetical protein